MNLWQLPILWLGGWLLIIVIHAVMRKSSAANMKKADIFTASLEEEIVPEISAELIKDGNNLFVTGFIFYLGNLLCYFIQSPVLHWIFLVAGILICLPPLISLVYVAVKSAHPLKKFQLIGGFLTAVIPFVMAGNIYFVYIAN